MCVSVATSTMQAVPRHKVALRHEGLMAHSVGLDDKPCATTAQNGPYDAILIKSADLNALPLHGIRANARQLLSRLVIVLVDAATRDADAEAPRP